MQKRVLTTGEIAKYCGVNFRTVIRWIERGYLKAYRLPGRGDNRVKVPDFLVFLQEYGMPIPEEFQSNQRRVLIVEDDTRMANAIQRALRKKGFETMIAQDGFQAGVLLGTFSPAVVTLDLLMPGIPGVDVIKFIRETDQLRKTRILIVSGMPKEQIDEAREAGAEDILAKPFEMPALLAKVTELSGVDTEEDTELEPVKS